MSESDTEFLDKGLWTPQTSMLRSIRDWVLTCNYEVNAALSIDHNPTLEIILCRRWPKLLIDVVQYPGVDVMNLSHLKEATYGLVYSHQVLEHVPKPWVAAAEMVRVLKPGGLGIHTSCAFNPRHGPPNFNDYYRFLPDGLRELFEDIEPLEIGEWGNKQAILHNVSVDDGHGELGGRRFTENIGNLNDHLYPWHTWIIFQKK
jgi:SAM-dependent methyltransferase